MQRRGKRPNPLRFLKATVLGAMIGVFTWAVTRLGEVACIAVIARAKPPCTPILPAWFVSAAFLVVACLSLWSVWRWYDDHVRGRYQMDLMRWMDGSPYEE